MKAILAKVPKAGPIGLITLDHLGPAAQTTHYLAVQVSADDMRPGEADSPGVQ